MPEKHSKNILRFPQKNSQKEENKLLTILKATKEKMEELQSSETEDNSNAVSGVTVINNINIHGGNNQLAPGNLLVKAAAHHLVNTAKETPSNSLVDAINSAQKLQLRKLRDEIVDLSNECGLPKHPAAIMSALNTNMGVRKYDQIVSSDFATARTYLANIKTVFSDRIDFHKKREELRRYMIQMIAESNRNTQPFGTSGMLGVLEATSFSELEKMYESAIINVI
ncbi:hypothetical protein [Undibacterium sp. TJN19]|uniref:hypothetical protein n=1 Tax=Undibacterium sp. TJN19 TaxID=3413055 RepID=UPI003BF22ED9